TEHGHRLFPHVLQGLGIAAIDVVMGHEDEVQGRQACRGEAEGLRVLPRERRLVAPRIGEDELPLERNAAGGMTDTRDLERGNASLVGAVKGSGKAATPSRAQERETEDSWSHCRSPSRWRHCTFLSLAPWRATTSATTLNLSHFVARKIGQR